MARTDELVEQKFNDTAAFAEEASSRAVATLENMRQFLAELKLPESNDSNEYNVTIPSLGGRTAPVFNPNFERFSKFSGAVPGCETFKNINTISFSSTNLTPPSFTKENVPLPTLSTMGDAPTEPSINTVTIPEKPSLKMPVVPKISYITLPSPSAIKLPSFEGKEPNLKTLLPEDPAEFKFSPGVYTSKYTDVFNKILKDIMDGGTGLSPDIEQNIYDRGRERQRVENERLYQEVEDKFSASGFSLPSGTLASQLLSVEKEISRKNDQLNREITINQAELEQKNIQFSTEQARQIEVMLMDFFHQQENRNLEASKALAEHAVKLYVAKIDRAKLYLSAYQTSAEVYKQRVAAEQSKIEIYKAELEGVKILTDIQQSKVNIYTAQLGALDIQNKMFATEMESAKIQAEIETEKIEIYKTQVQAFIAKQEVDKNKLQLYSTQMEGERIKAGVYETETNSYATKIDAKKTELEANIKMAETTIVENNQKIEKYKADISRYQAEIEAEIKTAALDTDGFRVEADIYGKELEARSREYESLMANANNQIEYAKAMILKHSQEIELIQQGYISLNSLKEKGIEGSMNVNAQLAASAMNAVNASASQSISSSQSKTEATSDSFSETHTYDHDA